MLILNRRIGECLVIDDDIVVTVLGVKGNQVRIGVNAPTVRAVYREEIYLQLRDEDKPLPPGESQKTSASLHC